METDRRLLIGLLVLLSALGIPTTTLAHGAKIEYTIDTVIEIRATYDAGDPMGGAQVSVYSPDDPTTPWLTGVCDADGRFSFTPESARAGTWDVQVRQAGHGDIVHISVGGGTASSGGAGYTPVQIVLMGACVIWGFVGTALFFARRRA